MTETERQILKNQIAMMSALNKLLWQLQGGVLLDLARSNLEKSMHTTGDLLEAPSPTLPEQNYANPFPQ